MRVFKIGLLIFAFLMHGQLYAEKRQMESLDRGVVAVKVSTGVFISWRLLGSEKETSFNVYKNGTLFRTISATQATNTTDTSGKVTDIYVVKAVTNGVEEETGSKEVTPWAQQYLTVQLNRPEGGTTPPSYFDNRSSSNRITETYPDGEAYTYTPNDCSVGDVDGDGEYELIVKWDPSTSRDNSYSGMTGNVYLDAYKLNGTQLWRIDLGINIRAGAHYTQFLVYDFDGDGKAEVVCKTAPGTIDGKGKKVIMGSDDPNKDWRTSTLNSNNGYVLNGPEYLTIFSGETGAEINTIAYNPPRGSVSGWGDNYGNRVDRFLACVAYLDGVHPSIVMCRGYYTRSALAAYDFVGGKLVERWFHDSANSGVGAYGQGNHNLSVADVDDDGFDEIVYGSCAIDHDGKVMYRTGYGHGDAMHVSKLDPDLEGYQVWQVHEESSAYKTYGFEMHDAKTGKIIWGAPTSGDNGRGLAADIDARYPGLEMWSTNKDANGNSIGVFSCKGQMISTSRPSVNFRIYWDGDLQDELLDGTKITKWNASTSKTSNLLAPSGLSSCNSTKATPNLSADILGDWREEVIWYETANPSKLRIYTTTTATSHRLYTLMHDPVYRLAIAWQNVAYNQPPHLGFYIGGGVNDIPWPEIYTPKDPTGIKDIIYDTDNTRVFVDPSDVLRIYSDQTIYSVSIYSLSGQCTYQESNIRSTECNIPLKNNDERLMIVKISTDKGTKAYKVKN